ncbi:glycosyltransferase family 39 protein [Leptolyngbya sp. FACHB-261]|uniref:glycosyltransferase family 39 protein n=1 Tax=Leptolyngbya sp. FACHB-261 TaxID=2692806 RepID=UPI0016842BCF|nr:glycosyltransferase family 39 protein [Leptolyngbya sp. FACHB-261]MBD2103623.1 glycosyltransferase family 39 protein [Leptolyngbya sp. FACHB-261]
MLRLPSIQGKSKAWGFHSTWLQYFIIVVLVLGVFFRFVNIDHKVYWKDEAYTSLRISGYTKAQFIQQMFDGRELGLEELRKYQRPNPELGLDATIKSLATDAPQHSPLYFSLARFGMQWFGDSIAIPRGLSALFSLLVFPCLYWLCVELFESSTIGWVAMALMAVSPFQVLYAQEARQYSLWAAVTLLSSTLLLRALRLKTKTSWALYAVSVALGLYTYLFAALVTAAHGLYVLIQERFRLSKTVLAYALATIVSGLSFIPWVLVILDNSSRIRSNTAWLKSDLPLLSLLKLWARNISYAFFDIQFGYDDPFVYMIPPILLLVGYAFYFLCRKAPTHIWLFVLLLAVVPALPLALPDLLSGGLRSITGRYLIPSYLGIQLAVAYLLGRQVSSPSLKPQQQKLWQLVLALVISGGVISCAISSQAETWWTKSASYYDPAVAHMINKAERPLVISSDNTNVNVLSLSYLLDPKVRLILVREPNLPTTIPSGFSNVFLYNISPELRREFEQEPTYQSYKVERRYSSKPTQLWELVKQ